MGNGPEVVLRAVTEVMARAQSYGYLTAPWQGITHPVGLDTYTGGYRSLRRLGLRPEKLMPKSRQSKAAELEGVALNQLINVAVAEKASALRTEEYFQERGRRANRAETISYFSATCAAGQALRRNFSAEEPSKSALQGTLYFWPYLS